MARTNKSKPGSTVPGSAPGRTQQPGETVAEIPAHAGQVGTGSPEEPPAGDDTGEIVVANRPRESDIGTILIDDTVRGNKALPPLPEQTLEKALSGFDALVRQFSAEREHQAAQFQPVLNTYLRRWDEQQRRLDQESRDRPAEEVARAKKDLVERVNGGLTRLGLAIYRNNQPARLIVLVDDRHRRGAFWLVPVGSKKPLAQKANLSDLFDLIEGEPQVGLALPRREPLAEWRRQEQSRGQTDR